ncbi:Spy/CpxP family protein refolding chaperone [Desulfoferrobacter suflitae]|uniref:Spy/CpxP family protein refolding chaperone n=1 Tax=Desulfoferrobacter suflitae TaxID=2865782 RepID=UPI0021640ABA|nr:periplasmic heavy metal sensor [Desulfoferrobacter suflitae]MCK8603674.1 periplasmic heavy metal sensor [Desulfoferrobacter suflitae]
MKRVSIIVSITLGLLFLPWAAGAQPRHQWLGMSSYMLSGGVSLERLDLSSEQLALAHKFGQAYDEQIAILQGKLMSKRLELQSVFRNPQADAGVIRAKAREVFDLEKQCLNLAIDYQIQIRGILTAEQLRNWCTPNEWCLPHKWRKQE